MHTKLLHKSINLNNTPNMEPTPNKIKEVNNTKKLPKEDTSDLKNIIEEKSRNSATKNFGSE